MYKSLKPYVTPIALLIGSWVLNMATPDLPILFGIIIGLGTFWFVLAIFSNKTLLKNQPWILEWIPFLDTTGGFANAQQLTGRFIQDQSFPISMVAHDGLIRGRTFDDCDIYGPAVIHISGAGVGQLVSCTISGSAQNSLVVTQALPIGAIVTLDCNFMNCRFYKISFVGTKEQIAHFRAGFSVEPSGPVANQPQRPTVDSPSSLPPATV